MTTRRLILALDIATVFGWCLGTDAPAYGSVRLGGQDRPAKYAAMLQWLDDQHALHPAIAEIAVEAPINALQMSGHDAAVMTLGLHAHLELWCWDHGIRLTPVAASSARKVVIGKGSFPRGMAKPAVMGWCRENGLAPRDDNAADAIVLWAYRSGWRGSADLIGSAA